MTQNLRLVTERDLKEIRTEYGSPPPPTFNVIDGKMDVECPACGESFAVTAPKQGTDPFEVGCPGCDRVLEMVPTLFKLTLPCEGRSSDR